MQRVEWQFWTPVGDSALVPHGEWFCSTGTLESSGPQSTIQRLSGFLQFEWRAQLHCFGDCPGDTAGIPCGAVERIPGAPVGIRYPGGGTLV